MRFAGCSFAMCFRMGWGTGLREMLRAALAVSLCGLMAGEPLLGANTARRGPSAGVQPVKGEDRVLHALDRLTFGPKPGEVAAVQAMGLSDVVRGAAESGED